MNELINETNITRTTPGAKARTLLKVVNRKLNKSYQEFDVNFLRAFLPFAQGQFLDYLGDMLAVPRAPAQRAEATAGDQLVRFYVVNDQTFGDINNDLDIFIPSGTLISTGPNMSGIVYRVTVGVFLDRTFSQQFVSVEAVKDGQNSNVGPNTLIHHNFTNYSASEGLLVTNVGLIDNGSRIESDTNYRFRIANQVLAAERANETAVRLALLSVPGVADIVLRPYARGIGSYDAIIRAVVPNTPDSVIEACQESLARVQAHGISGLALKPRLTGLSFQVSVSWRAEATQSDRDQIRGNIQQALSDYINNLPIGEPFIVNEAIERVMSTDTRILNIGTAQQAFDLITVFKESKLRDNKMKEQLLNDYQPGPDEIIIIEPSVDPAIVVLDKN
jgi:uncharacterized phage protein gp47/JayE